MTLFRIFNFFFDMEKIKDVRCYLRSVMVKIGKINKQKRNKKEFIDKNKEVLGSLISLTLEV